MNGLVGGESTGHDERFMLRALANGATVRYLSSPNPWVGAVLVANDGSVFDGATEAPGGRHAERVALDAAGAAAAGSTVYTTLEPCAHQGRTGPCSEALIAAGVARVVVGIEDPDLQVAGRGIDQLRAAGIDVTLGVEASAVQQQLDPYLHHRRSGRPWVVVKLAATLDGRTAAADGTSQWITGTEARVDVHRLRAESDAIVVGAATVRSDDPSLTVRDWAPLTDRGPVRDPRRVVLGTAPADARVHPCDCWDGPLDELLDHLGSLGVVQVLVEGGAGVAGSFVDAGLVNQLVVYLAPALFGSFDARGMLDGVGAGTIAELSRGEFTAVERLGQDVRIDYRPIDENNPGRR